MPSTILVTGATGFIGRQLVPALAAGGFAVSTLTRTRPGRPAAEPDRGGDRQRLSAGRTASPPARFDLQALAGDPARLDAAPWLQALRGVHGIVHLAGVAHRHDSDHDPGLHDRINHRATLALAGLAREAGVRRFVFVSSINALGEGSHTRHAAGIGTMLTPDSPAEPREPYGASKRAAERGLLTLCASGAMRATIVRPPLVYGAGARGNLVRLMQWVRARRPVPRIWPANRRAMIGLPNLIDLLLLALARQDYADRIVMPADVHWSLAQLAGAIALAMDIPLRTIPVPARLIDLAGRLSSRQPDANRLTASLRVSDPWLHTHGGFHPRHPPEQAIAQMVARFLSPGCRGE